MKDYYSVLGIAKNATEEEIKSSYRRLALVYHPDTNNGNSESEDRFKEINEAYTNLSDQEKRKRYDTYGQGEPPPSGMHNNPFGTGGFWKAQGFRGGFSCGGKGMGGFGMAFRRRGCRGGFKDFSSFFNNERSATHQRIVHDLQLTAAEARSGAEKEILITMGGTTHTHIVRTPAGLKDGSMLYMRGSDSGSGGDIYFRISLVDS